MIALASPLARRVMLFNPREKKNKTPPTFMLWIRDLVLLFDIGENLQVVLMFCPVWQPLLTFIENMGAGDSLTL